MSQSSPKRRRLSAEPTHVGPQPESYLRSASATPRRASYLSPTKSSLQRSHPHLLRNSNRTPAQLRGHRLLQHVLSGDATDVSKESQEGTAAGGDLAEPVLPPQTNGDTSSHASAEVSRPPIQPKSTLQQRRQSVRSASQQLLDEQNAGYSMVPRLISSSHSRRRQFSLSPDEGEHALPPTPVELGRDPPPERPRGVASSSPHGSKSGSGRSRRRLPDSQVVTSSPTKDRANRFRERKLAQLDRDIQMANEVPEAHSDADLDAVDIDHDPPVEEPPEKIKERQTILEGLQAQTRKLLADTRDLEEALEADDVGSLKRRPDFLDLIKAAGVTKTLQQPLFGFKPSAFDGSHQSHHLNLFAPGGLNLTASTRTGVAADHAKVTHSIKVTAPSPWPPHVFCGSFEAVTNPEDLKVESISYTGSPHAEGISDELFQWIQARLANHLVRTDLAGLVWGMGMYFEVAIQRAKAFRALQQRHGEQADIRASPESPVAKPDKLSVDHAVILSQYMHTTSITLTSTAQPVQYQPDKSERQPFKLLAIWQISLSPTSEARSHCEMILSGTLGSVSQVAAALFDRLWRLEGYEAAVEAVWGLLDCEANAVAGIDGGADQSAWQHGSHPEGDALAKARKKRKKIA